MIKTLFKNNKILLFIVGCILVLLVFILIINNNDINDFKREYEKFNNVKTSDGNKYLEVNISEHNKMRYVTYDEVFEVFDMKGDAVIYIGYPKCSYCRSVAQVLSDIANDTDIDEIYYLDVEDKDTSSYGKLVDRLRDKFFVSDESKDKIYVPSVLFVANGKIVSYNKGTLFSHKDPYVKLDQSQVDGLSRIYKNGINDVINSKKFK